MSIEAMKQALDALYLKGDSPDQVRQINAAIKVLHAAIQQAEAQQPATSEPVWFHKHWCDGDDIFYRPDDNIPPGSVPLYTHPAPGVPDDVARDAISTVREQYRGTDWGKAAECICDAIDAAMTAAQAQKGGA